MSQYPPPYPQPPFQGYYYPPGGQRQRDPRAAGRRASVLMWVLGALFVLFGLFMALLMQPMVEWALSNAPPGQEAQMEQLRGKLNELEAAGGSLAKQSLYVGVATIAVGGLMGLLAFFVRGGSKGASVVGAVLTGLVLGYLLLSTLLSVAMGGAQALLGACFLLLPAGLMVLLLSWLIQSMRAPQMAPGPPGVPGPPPGVAPPAHPLGYPPPPGAPPPGYGPGFQPPAPPPGQPPVQFGYATKPPTAAPPPAPPQSQPLPQEPPANGTPP